MRSPRPIRRRGLDERSRLPSLLLLTTAPSCPPRLQQPCSWWRHLATLRAHERDLVLTDAAPLCRSGSATATSFGTCAAASRSTALVTAVRFLSIGRATPLGSRMLAHVVGHGRTTLRRTSARAWLVPSDALTRPSPADYPGRISRTAVRQAEPDNASDRLLAAARQVPVPGRDPLRYARAPRRRFQSPTTLRRTKQPLDRRSRRRVDVDRRVCRSVAVGGCTGTECPLCIARTACDRTRHSTERRAAAACRHVARTGSCCDRILYGCLGACFGFSQTSPTRCRPDTCRARRTATGRWAPAFLAFSRCFPSSSSVCGHRRTRRHKLDY